ncbi:hypothetical protein HYPSUDRAFT_1081494 [Hypholoma sublateritium FD-334 SS-4]|uniref:Tetraspanin Tsp2 family n=1 Tax=Hypholoma sublateritium (strain FD-334 SS-4) TaxID=945553 RepID=A0A0D2P304_HYPSF|nr:hypothetical protein HYPSUDRAFT_1081494 [Hypholoma sublateritium FD-334 SS-4]
MYLDPPNPPFNARSDRESSSSTIQGGDDGRFGYASPISSPSRSRNSFSGPDGTGLTSADSNVSLTVNYLPHKFSNPLLSSAGQRRRKPYRELKGRGDFSLGAGVIPKMGGGVEAFRRGESRMGGADDDDDDSERVEDGSGASWMKKPSTTKASPKLRWNKFKWTLFFTNLLASCCSSLTTYSFVGLIACLLTWFNIWDKADIIRVGTSNELILSTVASIFGILACIVGWAGILLNNRSFLAGYCFLSWVTFAFLLIPGYLTYKRRAFNLEGKINAQWSQDLGSEGRLRIQNVLSCCGYFSPFVEATISQTCYSRSPLPGCKLRYLDFERSALKIWYSAVFGLVPLQLLVMVAGLLCANHVTYRFGKGMMPKAYRLSTKSLAVIMDKYASQLAEQYGEDIASDILTRSRSDLQLDTMPKMPYAQPSGHELQLRGYPTTRYDQLAMKPANSTYK